MKIGFIGLGRMGRAMASRLVNGEHRLAVFNRSPEKAADLVQAGAVQCATIADVCKDRAVVITMLADDDALSEVVYGTERLLACLPAGSIHLCMGTHGAATIANVAESHRDAGQQFVAAPVLGRPDAAAAGQLGIVAAGAAGAVATCQPLFALMGRRVFDAGTRPESAAVVKLANNMTIACAIEAMAETFALTRKYDVSPQVFYEVLTEGLFSAPAYKNYGRLIAERVYDNVGFTTLLALKDADLTLAAADAARVPLPSLSVYRDHLLAAINGGDGDRDWSVIARVQALASGLDS
jgi:3-hydroxyisobutyrate dehydrogenase-like beta-hydroxyacid dehydrogenase